MTWVIVPAAGSGRRVGSETPKQYLPLHRRPMIEWTLLQLARHPAIEGLMVVLAANDRNWPGYSTLAGKSIQTCTGGATRAESVWTGLRALPPSVGEEDFVLVHDAARPCLRHADIDRLLAVGLSDPVGAILAAPVRDTLKRADGNGRIAATEPREQRWHALTPQLFRRGMLIHALETARQAGRAVTDEASAIEQTGSHPRLVEGAADNIKVTTAADFALAEAILQPCAAPALSTTSDSTRSHTRTGIGYDVHAFGPGDQVTLGGVRIPHSAGLVAHSDGDVLIHALCDALLGAAALGDIGRHFPPTEARWKNADSRVFLRAVQALLHERDYRIVNVDCVVVCEAPRLAPHIDVMRTCLAEDLQIDIGAIGIKATTSERLGFTGRGEGIAAQAIASIQDNKARHALGALQAKPALPTNARYV